MNHPHLFAVDEDLELWDQFVTAVRWLQTNTRPELTMRQAMQEALDGWIAEHAAIDNGGRHFG